MRGQRSKHSNIDLGLAISRATLAPGQCRSDAELAAYCGCERQNITAIAHNALRKIRRSVFRYNSPGARELFDHYFKK